MQMMKMMAEMAVRTSLALSVKSRLVLPSPEQYLTKTKMRAPDSTMAGIRKPSPTAIPVSCSHSVF